MIRKFNLTNGVSVVITQELAEKYELDAAMNAAEFVSILAAIVSAQDRKPVELNGGEPLHFTTTPAMSDASEEKLKIVFTLCQAPSPCNCGGRHTWEAEEKPPLRALHPYQQDMIEAAARGMFQADNPDDEAGCLSR